MRKIARVLPESGDEFDDDEERAKKAAKKAAAKLRDAARSEAAKAAAKAKEDAELAVGRRVVREEIMSLAKLLIHWKETTSDDPDVAALTEGIYKATMLLIGEDKTLKAACEYWWWWCGGGRKVKACGGRWVGCGGGGGVVGGGAVVWQQRLEYQRLSVVIIVYPRA